MDSASNPQGMETRVSSAPAAVQSQRAAIRPRPVQVVFFGIGVVVLAGASVLVPVRRSQMLLQDRHKAPTSHRHHLLSLRTMGTKQTPSKDASVPIA